MTDQELREAERLADTRVLKNAEAIDANYLRQCILESYAAACEVRRAEIDRYMGAAAQANINSKAERERAAKLLVALSKYKGHTISKHGWWETGLCIDVAGQAIAEFEANK